MDLVGWSVGYSTSKSTLELIMGRIREQNLKSIHRKVSESAKYWRETNIFGQYSLVYGMYHLVLIGNQEQIVRLAMDEQRTY